VLELKHLNFYADSRIRFSC